VFVEGGEGKFPDYIIKSVSCRLTCAEVVQIKVDQATTFVFWESVEGVLFITQSAGGGED